MDIIRVKDVNESLYKEIIKRIVNIVNPVKIILFGSYAYGNPGKESDLDLLIVMNNNIKSRREISSKIYGVLSGILIPKDIVVITLKDIKEWENIPMSFINTVLTKGKVLYERKN